MIVITSFVETKSSFIDNITSFEYILDILLLVLVLRE